MKTKEEVLNFYAVEIGKKYKITKSIFKEAEGKIFEIVNNVHYFSDIEKSVDDLQVNFSDLEMCYPLTSLVNYDYEEYKPILDDAEREYLQKYVMDNPAFKGRVKYIKKSPVYYKKAQFLEIETTYDDYAYLPYFKEDSMYKGMELEKEYTAQELGLKE